MTRTSEPRVVIDARMVGDVPHGIAQHVLRFAEGLSFIDMETRLPYEPIFLLAPGVSPAKIANFRSQVVHAPFLHPSELWEIPRVLRDLDAAVYHSPSFSSLIAAPCPWIVTIHDLNHLRFGGWKEKTYYQILLRSFARRARAVLTVSEFSRREIAGWAGMRPDRIEVVFNAVDPTLYQDVPPERVEAVLERHGLKAGEYFLCLSNPKPHKNIPTLVQAYSRFRRTFEAERSGQKAWPLVLSFRSGASGPGIKALGALSNLDAGVLLASAGAVVFPSLYEGFGLPPLEGATLGAPLIVSKIPPHQEVLSDLAKDEVLWVDPLDLDGWSRSFLNAQERRVRGASQETRQKLLQRFGFREFGQTMDRVYRRVLGLPI